MNASLTADQKALVEGYRSSMMNGLASIDATKAQKFVYHSAGFSKRTCSVSTTTSPPMGDDNTSKQQDLAQATAVYGYYAKTYFSNL